MRRHSLDPSNMRSMLKHMVRSFASQSSPYSKDILVQVEDSSALWRQPVRHLEVSLPEMEGAKRH